MEFVETSIGLSEIAIRMLAAALLAGVIGLERETKERPAGLRTYMLTSLAAAVFTILTLELSMSGGDDPNIQYDPIRIVEAVTAGVAFLAAGTIIVRRGDVTGLTTGAGMWLSGAIGVACGAGYYLIAALATAFALGIFVLVRLFEKALPKKK